MGNCLDLLFCTAQETIQVVVFNGGQEEFLASATVEQITSGPYSGYKLVHRSEPYRPLPPEMKLVSGEVYHLVPNLGMPCSPPSPQKTAEKENHDEQIRVVLTRKQLEEMLGKGGGGFTPEQFACQIVERFIVPQKWKPSLTTIPELQAC